MAARGVVAKQGVIKKIQQVFGTDYIGEYNNKIYVWAQENGESIQIAITLTCPKVQVEAVSSTGMGGDYNFDDSAPSGPQAAAPTSFAPAEITQEETDTIEALMARLGLS